MALIKCPECSKEISDTVSTCPSCGFLLSRPATTVRHKQQVSNTRSGAKWEGVGFALIVVGMLISMITSPSNHVGGALALVGFIVFIIGRFL